MRAWRPGGWPTCRLNAVLKVLADRVTVCNRGNLADPFGDRRDGHAVAPEQILREGHAPRQQIFHRRQPQGAGEPLEERGP